MNDSEQTKDLQFKYERFSNRVPINSREISSVSNGGSKELTCKNVSLMRQ